MKYDARERIKWTGKVSNEDVLRRIVEERPNLTTSRRRKAMGLNTFVEETAVDETASWK